jgi:hypothetical protein
MLTSWLMLHCHYGSGMSAVGRHRGWSWDTSPRCGDLERSYIIRAMAAEFNDLTFGQHELSKYLAPISPYTAMAIRWENIGFYSVFVQIRVI